MILLQSRHHFIAGFLPIFSYGSFGGRCRPLQLFAGYSAGHSWVAADHSSADYYQPFIHRLSAGHSQATTDHCIAGFLPVIRGFLLIIRSQVSCWSFAVFPTGHSPVATDHSFAGLSAGHSRVFTNHSFPGPSRVAADHSFAAHCQPSVRRLFCWSFVGRRRPLIRWLRPTICSQASSWSFAARRQPLIRWLLQTTCLQDFYSFAGHH